MQPLELVRSFVDAINAHDVSRLADLMSPDHRFVDSLGAVFEGREAMMQGWRAYFRMIPDYRIDIDESAGSDAVVILVGIARGTYSPDGGLVPENAWQTPAAFLARVTGNHVTEWRVFADNEPIRQRMSRATS